MSHELLEPESLTNKLAASQELDTCLVNLMSGVFLGLNRTLCATAKSEQVLSM